MAAKQAGKTDNQRKAFDFLKDHFESQAPFTKKDLEAVTTWKGKSFSTYWSKQVDTKRRWWVSWSTPSCRW